MSSAKVIEFNYYNSDMKSLAERLKSSRIEAGLTQGELARRAGVPNQSIIGSLETGYRKASKYIPAIAEVLNVESLWLSEGKGSKRALKVISSQESGNKKLIQKGNDFYVIPQYNTRGAMGNGLLLPDQPGVIQSWHVSKEWIKKNIKGHQSAKDLCIVTGFGDSMRPLFNPGDPLLIDISVNTVEFDTIYFFRVGNEGFIKRLQRIPGEGLRVLSANRDNYEPWTIKPDMDFQVLGRVLKVWRSEDF